MIKLRMIIILILIFSMWCPAGSYASTMESDATEQAYQEIEKALESYNKDYAYQLMQRFNVDYPYNDFPEYYMTNLSLMIKMERSYRMLDDMVRHSIELYTLTESRPSSPLRRVAVEALAYYDYLNFNNSKAAERLGEISLNSEGNRPYQYSRMLALLEVDQKNYEKALELYNDALKDPDIEKTRINSFFNEVAGIYSDMASIYYELGEYDLAIEKKRMALDKIAPADYDYLVDIKLSLAEFHYRKGDYDATREYLDAAQIEYEKTTDLFKTVVSENAMMLTEANLEYLTGNFESAAQLYFELNAYSNSPQSIEQTLAASEEMALFEKAQVDEQLSLLERLADEESQKNQIQAKYLSAASVIIVLMFVLILLAVWSLTVYNKQQKKLYALSITDQLTNMYNRRRIIEEFESIKQGSKCIALIDIDYFKKINDHYGHMIGDQVLQDISKTIKDSLRAQDHIGRYGGEEFLVILDTPDIRVAVEIMERVRQNVENIKWDIEGIKTTISIGLVEASFLGDPLLVKADELLYESKASGRNRMTYA